ncbi:MAG TPA: PilZ domain-containing protein [Thermoanaerobaculia bacterium]|nr:PilZ domain-containing protein [Thermoanaerobaculia bacterium]
MSKEQRTVPRYFLDPTLPGLSNGRPVRIVDLGVKGGRLELASPIEPGTAIDLTIDTIHLRATVLWCQVDALNFAADYDGYLAGVAFDQPSDAIEQLLQDLHSLGRAVRIEELRSHDRYRITAPLTGSFGDIAPVSIIDLSVRGVRLATIRRIGIGYTRVLRFQVDEEMGPIEVTAKVAWCKPSPMGREFHAGLEIDGAEEKLRDAIHLLCTRNEARIDMDSLRRKFDAMRLASRLTLV